MKNQYFADVNDYRKYGLLRALQSSRGLRLLVVWMLTPDDGGPDGKFRSYLQQPTKWRHFDPELFDGLSEALRATSVPNVSLIERSGLLPHTSYYSTIVPDARVERDSWRDGLLKSAAGVDLVFVDPDNGIEIPSCPVGRKRSSKYVIWSEIQQLWGAGCSLLIYQHFRREAREAFAIRVSSELRAYTGTRFVWAFRTAHVLFLLAAQKGHREALRRGVTSLTKRWEGQIRIMEKG